MNFSSNTAISVKKLSFSYSGQEPTFSNFGLEVPEGSIFGLLGANGIGKSTLMKLLVGLLHPQEGQVQLLGRSNPREAFRHLGLMIEQPNLYAHLSGRGNLEVMAAYRGLPASRIGEVLSQVELEAQADKLVRHYSSGMKQRLGIAMALLPPPRLLLLDEPSNGLDPAGIVTVRRLIRKLKEEQHVTILLSSHLISEVEQLCTHVGILGPEGLAYQGTLAGLREQSGQGLRLQLECRDAKAGLEILERKGKDARLNEEGQLEVQLENKRQASGMIALLQEQGVEVYQAIIDQNKLEDFYLNLYQ